MIKPEYIYALFVMKIRQEYEVSVVNRGKYSQTCLSDSSQCPFVLRDKDAPFLWVQRGHISQEGLMTYFKEKGQRKVQVNVLPLLFFQTPQLKYSISKVPSFGGTMSQASPKNIQHSSFTKEHLYSLIREMMYDLKQIAEKLGILKLVTYGK